MLPDLCDSKPLLGIDLHDVLHQVFSLFINIARHKILARENLLVELIRVWVFEWQIADSHRVENDTHGPDICVEAIVSLASNHLRRCIAWATTSCFESVALRLVGIAQTEIDYLDVHVLIEEEVLWLEVTVTYLVLVKVFHTGQDLVEKATGFTILESPLLDDVVEELTTWCVLHDQEQLLRRFNNFIQLHDVRMSHYLENVNLSHDPGNVCLVFDFVFFEDFDCDFLLGQLVGSLSDFTEGA